MYKVIVDFIDLADNRYNYRAGEEYPRLGGVTPTKERIAELLSNKNKVSAPVIVTVDKDKKEVNKKATESIVEPKEVVKEVEPMSNKATTEKLSKTDINRMPKDKLVELASANGMDNVEDASGSQIKEYLINYFGL